MDQDEEKKIGRGRNSNIQRNMLDDGYDENFVGDQKDKEYLESLSQLERERIIKERHQERDKEERKKNIYKILYLESEKDNKKVISKKNIRENSSRPLRRTKKGHKNINKNTYNYKEF